MKGQTSDIPGTKYRPNNFLCFFVFVISSYRWDDYRARNAQMKCICMHFKCMPNAFLKQALSSAQRGELMFVCQMYL